MSRLIRGTCCETAKCIDAFTSRAAETPKRADAFAKGFAGRADVAAHLENVAWKQWNAPADSANVRKKSELCTGEAECGATVQKCV